jgi:hypothetical protein
MEPLETKDAADDIDNRIKRAHLVQVHSFDRHLVDGRFGFRESVEQGTGPMFCRFRQSGPIDELMNLRHGAMRMFGVCGIVMMWLVVVIAGAVTVAV